MELLINIYLKILLACVISPVGIFLFVGLGSAKLKNILVYAIVTIILFAVTVLGGYFPVCRILMPISGVLAVVALFPVCSDCIMTKFDDVQQKLKKDYEDQQEQQ